MSEQDLVTVSYGVDNEIRRPYGHTSEIFADKAALAFLGASSGNIEARLDGVAYDGPLQGGENVELVQKANSKQ